MCIAIVKPKGAKFPTTQQFKNCFDSNPHGAGFMYSDGENLIIKKGFMTFNDFLSAFEKENIPESKLVFFHFRIATHGLVDGGNTHPFPVVKNVQLQRQQELKFKGFGLIHNGVFTYDKAEYFKYDKTGVISDTMLLSMKIKEQLDKKDKYVFNFESAISYNITTNNELVKQLIERKIGYNKVAIMNEKEEFVKYGNWIYDNGVFYSNDDYEFNCDYNYYSNQYHNLPAWNYVDDYPDYEQCAICSEWLPIENLDETTIGFCCRNCSSVFHFKKCKHCSILIFDEDDNGTDYCDDCANYQIDCCDYCGEPLEHSCIVTADNTSLCANCYNRVISHC